MRCWHILVLASILILSGCSTHYYRVKDDVVYIHLKMPEAKTVYFASSLDGYRLHRIEKANDKSWIHKVSSSAEFKYFYVVDGKVFLPQCMLSEADDFGSNNCIYEPGM